MKPVRLHLVTPLAGLLLLASASGMRQIPASASGSRQVPASASGSRQVLLATAAAQPAAIRDTFHFTGVTLTDGDEVFERAEIYVRVKETSGGYTRADYLDERGRRLGFYEAFEVVSTDESALRVWAIRNFPDRTQG